MHNKEIVKVTVTSAVLLITGLAGIGVGIYSIYKSGELRAGAFAMTEIYNFIDQPVNNYK